MGRPSAVVASFTALLACGCSSPATRAPDAGGTDAAAGACTFEAGSRIEADFRGLCPEGSIHITSAADWDLFVERCVVGDTSGLPTIDWQAQEVLGTNEYASCPLAPGTTVLKAQACDRTLRTRVWTWTDYCWCDYFDLVMTLYLVERDRFDTVEREVVAESNCEDVTCNCDGAKVSACDTSGACDTDWETYPEHDGLPPAE